MIRVPVYCATTFGDGRICHAELADHVHQPKPCPNGHDERHHAFAPPRTVTVSVFGQRRRVKVPT